VTEQRSQPTVREQAEAAARHMLCICRYTDGFCDGRDPSCKSCGNFGSEIGVAVLRRIRPTLRRVLFERGVDALAVEMVMICLDEAVAGP